jgi:uncharacterized protein YsxB (DUF464 family)
MITVRTADHDAGIRLTVDGHAGDGDQAARICAGVSTLVATALRAMYGDTEAGAHGHNDLVFPGDELSLAGWTIAGLQMIAAAHPTFVTIDRGDTRLRSTP